MKWPRSQMHSIFGPKLGCQQKNLDQELEYILSRPYYTYSEFGYERQYSACKI